jgi:hypothetical protein
MEGISVETVVRDGDYSLHGICPFAAFETIQKKCSWLLEITELTGGTVNFCVDIFSEVMI